MMEIRLVIDQQTVTVTTERQNVDRDPVESLEVDGVAIVRLSKQSAIRLGRKLLNAAGVREVYKVPSRPREDS
jgi:hypothetical protein